MSVRKVVYYEVIVKIPNRVWEEFRENREFSAAVFFAVKDSLDSGTEWYDTPIEWATFKKKSDAVAAEKKLKEVINRFKERLKYIPMAM